MTAGRRVRRLPGGWFSVAGTPDWLLACIGQVVLLWILPWPMMLIGRFGSARARHATEQVWARSAARVLRLRITLRGRHLVDPSRPYLVMALHDGLADPLVLFRLPLPLRFVARDELRWWPVVGAYLRMTGQLMTGDGNRVPARRLLRHAQCAVQRGESIAVFPQGSVLGIEIGFRPGALRMAQALELSILPVVISGTHRVWEHPFSPRLRFGQRVTATILPPVEVTGLDRRQLAATMLDLERTMKQIALGPDHVAPRRYRPERDGMWDDYVFVIDPAFGAVSAALPHRVRRDRWTD
ncbi:MAG: lysophospholipid acyltransferase family protein [Chloroflexota bacterium]